MEEERELLWRDFLVAHRRLTDQLEIELERVEGMPLAFYDVLVNLSAAGGHARMAELADRVLLSRSGLTRLVDRMVDAGLVERRQCPSDRRGQEAVLTPVGQRALEHASPVHLDGVERHFDAHLSDGEAKALRKFLDKVLAGLGVNQPGS